jgi:hypothetical protein
MARTERLRVSLDAKYPAVVGEAEALLRRCFSGNRVGRQVLDGGATVVLCVYNRHLSCVLPQHAPGKKHEREIQLEPWQLAALDAAPWAFLRGCIRSDGCTFINRTGRYTYLSYEFRNLSAGILGAFADTCETVGLHPRRYRDRVRLCRRDDVALLLQHVGTKN